MQIRDLANKHVCINPGSVGQPRDGDPRACYAIYDESSIQFIRTEYNLTKTQNKISQLPIRNELKKHTIKRLGKGK